jgi:hypothetical protein
MDKTIKYEQIIIDFLRNYAAVPYANKPEVENQLVIDRESHHYQLLAIGWHGDRFIYHPVFHFDIRDGKIWVQQNNTEETIAEHLLENGVPPTDIVAGFYPPSLRVHTGFAVA